MATYASDNDASNGDQKAKSCVDVSFDARRRDGSEIVVRETASSSPVHQLCAVGRPVVVVAAAAERVERCTTYLTNPGSNPTGSRTTPHNFSLTSAV